MSHFTQMAGLAVQNFVSPAVGLAVAIALIRGLTRRRSDTIGNFWVDLTRGVLRVFLPISFVVAIVFLTQGVVQNLHGFEVVQTLERNTQVIPGGPSASQEAIKIFGHERWRVLERQLRPPADQPERLHELLPDLPALGHRVLADLHLRQARRRQEAGLRAARGHGDHLARRRRPRDAVRDERQPEARRARREPVADARPSRAGTTRARRSATASPGRRSSPGPRRARRPARSTRCTTATRRSAA